MAIRGYGALAAVFVILSLLVESVIYKIQDILMKCDKHTNMLAKKEHNNSACSKLCSKNSKRFVGHSFGVTP